MATCSVFLLVKFHEQRSLAVYSPWGFRELDMIEWLSTHTKHLPGNNSENLHEKVHLKRCNMSWLMKLRISTLTTETTMRRKKHHWKDKNCPGIFSGFSWSTFWLATWIAGASPLLPLRSGIECARVVCDDIQKQRAVQEVREHSPPNITCDSLGASWA